MALQLEISKAIEELDGDPLSPNIFVLVIEF